MNEKLKQRIEKSTMSALDYMDSCPIGSEDRKVELQVVTNLIDKISQDEKNQDNLKIEMAKQKISWDKYSFEYGKILITAITSAVIYNIFQKRILTFEEYGCIRSFAGKELHLPKLFNK